MPEKETVERAKRAKRKGKSSSTQAGEFVREEMHHIREGKHGAQRRARLCGGPTRQTEAIWAAFKSHRTCNEARRSRRGIAESALKAGARRRAWTYAIRTLSFRAPSGADQRSCGTVSGRAQSSADPCSAHVTDLEAIKVGRDNSLCVEIMPTEKSLISLR